MLDIKQWVLLHERINVLLPNWETQNSSYEHLPSLHS